MFFMNLKVMLLAMTIMGLSACGSDSGDSAGNILEQEESLGLEILMDRSDVVWGFDFLPDGRIIFTEREGSMGILNPDDGLVTNISGEPSVYSVGEGGLLDVRVHQDFNANNFIYFCFAQPEGGGGRNVMARAQLINNQLVDVERIFVASDTSSSSIHFGCRIEFDNSGHVFLSLGERSNRLLAQNLSSHLGKIIRVNDDGSVPANNPFVNQAGARPEIYSLGHRNVQGLKFRPGTGDLWASELGPVGGDEVNIIRSGSNYGWPIISHGSDPGGVIEATSRAGFVDPISFWVPSISPSAIEFLGDQLFIANLSGQHIRRLVLDGNSVTGQDELFENLGWRFRNLRVGPDDVLYFSTDEGRLGRIIPE